MTNLVEELVGRGEDVTLFATQNALTKASLTAASPRPWEEDPTLDPKVWEYLHISQVMEEAKSFDLIHNSFDFMPLTYSRLITTPMITTIHGFSLDQYRLAYRKYSESKFVSISDADRDPYLQYVSTVYNGIRLDQFTFRPQPGDYLAFVGRIHPDKGVHLAIELAKRACIRLRIAGIIQDQVYFDSQIHPHIDGKLVEFVGPVDPAGRDELFGQALASLHLTTIPERFGLAMAESMATGTPVIGFDRGSVREVVADGKTGFVVHDLDQAVIAISEIGNIQRKDCRTRVESLFSVAAMASGYLQAYGAVLRTH